jgi:hypothetical protein
VTVSLTRRGLPSIKCLIPRYPNVNAAFIPQRVRRFCKKPSDGGGFDDRHDADGDGDDADGALQAAIG